jgi:hypothetical protein
MSCSDIPIYAVEKSTKFIDQLRNFMTAEQDSLFDFENISLLFQFP